MRIVEKVYNAVYVLRVSCKNERESVQHFHNIPRLVAVHTDHQQRHGDPESFT